MVSRMGCRGWGWWGGIVVGVLLCVHQTVALPLPHHAGLEGEGGGTGGNGYLPAILGVAVLLGSITTLAACACCKRSRGFKELGSVSSRVQGSNNTLSQGPVQEITLFPPPGVSSHLSLSTTQINFEPLPDIRPRASTHPGHIPLPASFPSSPLANLPTDQWFAEPHQNFPRGQLQYVKELGNGWFGKVLEGRASGIFSDHTKGESPPVTSTSATSRPHNTRVAVKVLKEDASQAEQTYFLHELRPYRDLTHPNVLKVLAYCLETEPFLILLQLCPKGDLKSVVRGESALSESALLRMVLDAASGLQHMHSQNFIHTDLAARNCLVDEDNTVKIGDYGYNIDSYKNEYYCAGDVALPLRWCAPETLRCTDTTIETKEVTKPANVWSFGIVMWEVLSRGELPYPGLDDDQVIQKVVVDRDRLPHHPTEITLHADKLYNIMRQCWAGEETRPPMTHILSLLTHLWQHSPHHTSSTATTTTSSTALTQTTTTAPRSDLDDFEVRWEQLQRQQHHQNCRDHSILHLGNPAEMRFESDFSLSGPSQLVAATSPSLQNLHGSAEDLDAKMAAKFGSALPSWLGVEPGQPIDSLTQEITDAILKLDNYLAGEKSEPSTAQTSPEKSGINFKLGKDSFVSNPPDAKVARITGLSVEEGSGHPSLTRSISEGEDEGFTMRLEQGEFTEMVRLKSQSVQDFMKLTVVDDNSDSDNASQRNSLAFEPLHQEKTFTSEGNIKEALRDVKFMGDLERLQAEHRYSIITEASREYPSSIEYRMQDVNLELPPSHSEVDASSEAGSMDKLAASSESVNSSSNFLDRGHSEQDPFLGENISSEWTGERKSMDQRNKTAESQIFNYMKQNNETVKTESQVSSSLKQKPLLASPDCVVSSREPKPITLPDIVVHNSNVRLSTPSPSPQDSPAKIINKDQPKEFRFVFEGDGDGHNLNKDSNELEAMPPCDSVIFSENIKNMEANHIEESVKSASESQEDSNEKTSSHNHQSYDSGHGQSMNGDVRKFQSLIQEKSNNLLTSTPLKTDSLQNQLNLSQDKVNDGTALIYNSSDIASEDTDLESTKEINTFDNSSIKRRLVFGRSEEKSKVEEEESNEGEARLLEAKDFIDTPIYKPEKIVEGEDVVIGALEDFSLDLYRAVKSTDTPLPCPSEDSELNVAPSSEEKIDSFLHDVRKDAEEISTSPVHSLSKDLNIALNSEKNTELYILDVRKDAQETSASSLLGLSKDRLEREISRTESEVSGIEFDLEQWDTFLDKSMSVDKIDPDVNFKDTLVKVDNVESDILTSPEFQGENQENVLISPKCYVETDENLLSSTMKTPECYIESKENILSSTIKTPECYIEGKEYLLSSTMKTPECYVESKENVLSSTIKTPECFVENQDNILSSTMKTPDINTDKVNDGKVNDTLIKTNISGINSTLENNTCDEICDIMGSESSAECSQLDDRPEVNASMFFRSESMNSKEDKGETNWPLKETEKVDSLLSTYDSPSNQKLSDDSFYTPETSKFFQVEAKNDSILAMYNSPSNQKLGEDSLFSPESSELFNSAKSTINSKLLLDNPNALEESTDSSFDRDTPRSQDGSSFAETPSNSFSYRREAPVDSTMDSIHNIEVSAVETLPYPVKFDEVSPDNVLVNSEQTNSKLLSKDSLVSEVQMITRNENDKIINISERMSGDSNLEEESEKSKANDKTDNECTNLSAFSPICMSPNYPSPHQANSPAEERSPSHTSPSQVSPPKFSPFHPASPPKSSPYNSTSPSHTSSTQASPFQTSPINPSTKAESREGEETETAVENGDFWQQQMMAWQEAAFETRQLLQEAADGSGRDSADGSTRELIEERDSTDCSTRELVNEGGDGSKPRGDISENSPTSNASSHYSSTDMLNLDDEGSYISYNTTDDEEVLGYKPEDINALRAELSLKLGGALDDQNQNQHDLEPVESDEEISDDRENVLINYRGIMASTLSPIKEESYLEDEDSPVRKLSIKSSSDMDSIHDPSIEFEEPDDDASEGTNSTFTVNEAVNEQILNLDMLESVKEDTFVIPSTENLVPDINVGLKSGDQEESTNNESSLKASDNILEMVKMDNPHDSLILEDLDEEDGPSSIQIINPRAEFEAEDILVVDIETNQATILDQGLPRSHLAFITDEEELERTEVQPFVFDETDDVAPESIPSVGGSRFDEMCYREQFLTNNPSWEKRPTLEQQDFDGDSESKPVTDFLINDLLPESSETPQEVPHYHSYFTSALSNRAHPNAASLTLPATSLERPVEPQHISLPYDVNYPMAGEDINWEGTKNSSEHKSLPFDVNYSTGKTLGHGSAEVSKNQSDNSSLPYDVSNAKPISPQKDVNREASGNQSDHPSFSFEVNYPVASKQLKEELLENEAEHASLSYDVNYTSAGEQLNSLEDIKASESHNGEETKISEIEDDDETPIKLNFLGRYYSDESEEKFDKEEEMNNKNDMINEDTSSQRSDQSKSKKDKKKSERTNESADSREASLLSDSEDDEAKVSNLDDPSKMTSAEFLASETYQTNDAEEIEEEIEVEAGYVEDSDDDDEARSPKRTLREVGEQVSQDPRYTPDWESDSDSDGDSSSTSGEFMWREEDKGQEEVDGDGKEGEQKDQPGEPCQPASYILDVIEEEPEREARREDEESEGGSGGEESESGEEEFTPSQWNSDLTPTHSLLKSPLNKSSSKKRVRWKRQRHHRVYEYPPEPRSWEPPPPPPTSSTLGQPDLHLHHQQQQHRRAWQRSLDYLTLADWELGSDEFIADDGGDMDDYVYHKPTRPAPPPPIYSLGSMTYDDNNEAGFVVDNGEFFIRSSGSPFPFTRSTFSASDFFPATQTPEYEAIFGAQAEKSKESQSYDKQLKALDRQEEYSNPQSNPELINEYQINQRREFVDDKTIGHESDLTQGVNESDSNFPTQEDYEQAGYASGTSVGQLRHTRDRLRLEIPTISVGSEEASGSENGLSFPSGVNLTRHEPEVSEV